jgi:hypothetical protein
MQEGQEGIGDRYGGRPLRVDLRSVATLVVAVVVPSFDTEGHT